MTRTDLTTGRTDRLRDDLTVEVIFFGQGSSGDNVVQNLEATASSDTMKPRL